MNEIYVVYLIVSQLPPDYMNDMMKLERGKMMIALGGRENELRTIYLDAMPTKQKGIGPEAQQNTRCMKTICTRVSISSNRWATIVEGCTGRVKIILTAAAVKDRCPK